MSEVRLIDANALKRVACVKFYTTPYYKHILDLIDNAPTVEYPFYQEAYQTGYEEGKNKRPQAENALLMDIAHSLAIIADNSMKEGNTQESGNETLHWVHSEAHKVMCPKCGCRVSINAAYEMNYCFKCGSKLGGIKNE